MDHASLPKGGRKRFAGLMLGSMGVVFGDIGTSPLYGFKTAITQAARGPVGDAEILGVVSLTLWALILVVTIKYVTFIMRADNHGEGGILSLMALAQSAMGGRTPVVLALGVVGAALFYGDAIITPAISVLSAVEGLKTAPGFADLITPSVVIAIGLVVLIGLFLVQSRGTAKVAACSGRSAWSGSWPSPSLGLMHIPGEPGIFLAFNPLLRPRLPAASRGDRPVRAGLGVPDDHRGRGALRRHGPFRPRADPGGLGRRRVPGPGAELPGPGRLRPALPGTTAGQAAGLKDQDWFFLMAPERRCACRW